MRGPTGGSPEWQINFISDGVSVLHVAFCFLVIFLLVRFVFPFYFGGILFLVECLFHFTHGSHESLVL